MKFYLPFLFMMFIGLFSCTNRIANGPESALMNDWNKRYKYVLDFFPDSLVHHFPTKLDTTNITFNEALGASDLSGNLELIVINNLNKDSTLNFEQNIVGSYNAGDSCLFVLNEYINMDNYGDVNSLNEHQKLPYNNKVCNDSLYPIPNFWHNDYTTDSTLCKLPDDFVIYVIDSKPGKFIDKELLNTRNIAPAKWKNGLSRGYAVSTERNVIIYWLIVW